MIASDWPGIGWRIYLNTPPPLASVPKVRDRVTRFSFWINFSPDKFSKNYFWQRSFKLDKTNKDMSKKITMNVDGNDNIRDFLDQKYLTSF